MDAVFSFLFGTRTGFAILFAGGILLFICLFGIHFYCICC